MSSFNDSGICPGLLSDTAAAAFLAILNTSVLSGCSLLSASCSSFISSPERFSAVSLFSADSPFGSSVSSIFISISSVCSSLSSFTGSSHGSNVAAIRLPASMLCICGFAGSAFLSSEDSASISGFPASLSSSSFNASSISS